MFDFVICLWLRLIVCLIYLLGILIVVFLYYLFGFGICFISLFEFWVFSLGLHCLVLQWLVCLWICLFGVLVGFVYLIGCVCCGLFGVLCFLLLGCLPDCGCGLFIDFGFWVLI